MGWMRDRSNVAMDAAVPPRLGHGHPGDLLETFGGALLQGFVKQEMFLWVWSQLPVTVLPLDFLSELPTLPNGGPSPSVSHCPVPTA